MFTIPLIFCTIKKDAPILVRRPQSIDLGMRIGCANFIGACASLVVHRYHCNLQEYLHILFPFNYCFVYKLKRYGELELIIF